MSKRWEFPKRVFAHRGGGTLSPENTICAFDTGLKYGFRAAEFDVMLTMDKVPILMHDTDLRRTVRALQFEGKCVSEVLANDILQMDAGSWKSPAFDYVRVPLCEDVIKYCIENQIIMNVEIKPAPNHDVETGEVVAELVSRYFPSPDSELMPLFSSFSFDSLLAAKRVAPHIPRAYLIESVEETPEWKQQMAELEAVSLNINHKHLTPELAAEIKTEGFSLFCFTVNDVVRAAELLAIGVDAFCTDRLDLFQGFEC